MKKIAIKLYNLKTEDEKELLILISVAPPWKIEVGKGLLKKDFRGDDLFDCLQKLRGKYEKKKWLFLCNGARKNAFPSRMSMQMSGGTKLYLLELGKPATMLVDIFEEISKEESCFVSEQQQFYTYWLDSLQEGTCS